MERTRIEIKISPNQEKGRRGLKPQAFVIHVTEGAEYGAIEWCMSPKSQVSYHYIVKKNGDIVELVNPENIAWHAGRIIRATWDGVKNGNNPNLYTIGIAYAGFANEGPTFEQVMSMIRLLHELAEYYKIPLDKNTVVGHNQIRADKTCPGQKIDPALLCEVAKFL